MVVSSVPPMTFFTQVGTLGEQLGDEVGAVVHGDLRLVVERCSDVRVIGGVVLTLDGERGDVVVLHERCGNVVLRRKRIRGAQAPRRRRRRAA